MGSSAIFRRLARRAIPLNLRQEGARLRRVRGDRLQGIRFGEGTGGEEWASAVTLWQPVMPSQVFQAKLANLQRGASLLHLNRIEAGGLWSFWHRLGKPTLRNGFVRGRNIVDGRLVLQVGGGLCQLSSLIYHLALLGGLEVVERHHHSIDIYREEDRFTPLGADATVVWGFKDLRLRNPYSFPISIGCFLEGHTICGEIRSEGKISPCEVEFVREQIHPGRVRVHTIVQGLAFNRTDYEQQQGMECR